MDSLFYVALQSGLLLGLVHGVNPCGHSWLVLAPFVSGEKNGRRVSLMTLSFIGGTTLGCLVIGLALGMVSASLPESIKTYTDLVTAGIIILLGAILIVKPHLLHSHDHDHDHDHHHDEDHHHAHEHEHTHCSCSGHAHHHHTPLAGRASTLWGLATIGFVNMIVPCPTVAIMYSYALDSASALKAVAVFGIYAVGTAIALGGVIYAIYTVTSLMRRLQQSWIEPLIMRTVGVMTIFFGVYSLYSDYMVQPG